MLKLCERNDATIGDNAFVQTCGRTFVCTLCWGCGAPEFFEPAVEVVKPLPWLAQHIAESTTVVVSRFASSGCIPESSCLLSPNRLKFNCGADELQLRVSMCKPLDATSILLEHDGAIEDQQLVACALMGKRLCMGASFKVEGTVFTVAEHKTSSGYRGIVRVLAATKILFRKRMQLTKKNIASPPEWRLRADVVVPAVKSNSSLLLLGAAGLEKMTSVLSLVAEMPNRRCVVGLKEDGGGGSRLVDEKGTVVVVDLRLHGAHEEDTMPFQLANLMRRRSRNSADTEAFSVIAIADVAPPAAIRQLFDIAYQIPAPTDEEKLALFHDSNDAQKVLLQPHLQRLSLKECRKLALLGSSGAPDADAALAAELHRKFGAQVSQLTTMDRIGGMEETKKRLGDALFRPLEFPQQYKKFGVTAPKGILLYGPPGNGKTSLVKAICAAGMHDFHYVDSASLISAYVGESEANLRAVFTEARTKRCVVFFDEVDAIGSTRATGTASESDTRLLSCLLTEMDGFNGESSCCFIGATNLIDSLDSALLRPGRFDMLIEVASPNDEDRAKILELLLRPIVADDDTVDVENLISNLVLATGGYSGAELSDSVRKAGCHAVSSGCSLWDAFAAVFA